VPKFYNPTPEEFAVFERLLIERRFRLLTEEEVAFQSRSLSRPKQGRLFSRTERGCELGYVMAMNGLEVVVWTSWLLEKAGLRIIDTGKVLIRSSADPEKVFYWSRPMHRTKNFLKRLFESARRAAWRVRHAPHCEECGQLMEITFRHNPDHTARLRSCFWKCNNVLQHSGHKATSKSWDCMFSPEQKARIEADRKPFERYRRQRRAAGKDVDCALKRKIAARSRDVRR
jgi:hypothetical protein